jgi:hypothetical protein
MVMLHRDSEMHRRRRGRNFALLAVLIGFIVLVFWLTVVKVQTGGLSQGFDHVLRPEAIPGQTTTQTQGAPR